MRRAAPLEAADAGPGLAAAATFCASDSHPDPIDYGKVAIDTDMNLSTGITEFAGADDVAGTIDGVSARLLRTPSSLADSWTDAGPVYVGRPDLRSIGLGLPWSKVGSPTTFRYSGWLESIYTLPDSLPNTGAHIVTVSGGAPQAVPSAPPQPPAGPGYWMIGSDGGVFSFGDAQFFGSMGGIPLNRPVNGIVPTPSNLGYWLVASDGGIFAFGDAVFRGSMGGTPLNRPVIGAVRFGNGYLMVASDGGIFNFSDQPFFGSLGANPPAKPIAAVAVFG